MSNPHGLARTIGHAVRIAVTPQRATGRLLGEPGRLRHGVVAWILLGVAYGLVAFVGGLNGIGAYAEPWLPIPADTYYLWMGPLTPAIYLLHFIVLSGLIQLGGKLVGGRGTFEDTFTVVSLTFFFPVLITMWVIETPYLVFFPAWRRDELGGIGFLPEWLDIGRQLLGVAWILVILTVAVSRVQRLRPARAAAITLLASIPAWLVTLTYLR